jgi:hypothetical protein
MFPGTILRAAAVVAVVTVACDDSSGGTQCLCADPTVHIVVPADRAPYAGVVTFSGRGCPTATAQCTQPVGAGCAEFTFQGQAIGACELDLAFSEGPADFSEQLAFVGYPCCPGFYVSPPSADPVEVPDLGDDAGFAGDDAAADASGDAG